MNTLEMLTRENKKLEREIEQLEFSNAILSRLFYYAAKKLGKYSVPFRYEPQDGKIDFRKIGDIVEVIFSAVAEESATGDPDLDEIFSAKNARRFY